MNSNIKIFRRNDAVCAMKAKYHSIIRQSGMSLIEIVVSLFILGLLLTITAQGASRMLNRWEEASKLRDVANSIEALSYKALSEQRTLNLSSNLFELIKLPPGWSAQVMGEIVFLPTGLCSGGEVQFTTEMGTERKVQFSTPDCRVEK